MKVLVATKEGQGQRLSDFFDSEEGELVFPIQELNCHFDAECGCRRSLTGLSGLTTTFKLEDRSITLEEYREKCRETLIKVGAWSENDLDEKYMTNGLRKAGASEEAICFYLENFHPDPVSEALSLVDQAKLFAEGTVLEKRGDELYPRTTERPVTDTQKVRDLIRQGESTIIEFKQSLSLDIKKQTKESYIEHSALKSITGFLNSNGGHLLVGVCDDGTIAGVDVEIRKFHASSDRFLLHFKNLVKSKIGEPFYPFIDYRLVRLDGIHVLLVECLRSLKPCFLEDKDFYVRTNPATDKLEGAKLLEYIKHRFGS